MELNIAPAKVRMIMCRFDYPTFDAISELATQHGTSRGKIIRALVEGALKASNK